MREAKHVMQRSRLAARDKARRPTARVQLPGKTKIICDSAGPVVQLGANNQRVLDAKDRVALQVLIAFEEQVRNERTIAGRTDHEMDVRGAKRMPSQGRQQLTGGTVVGNRIADRQDGLESVEPCRIGTKTRPQVSFGLVR